MDAINFYGGSSVPLPSAYYSIKALYKLMKKNPKMVISIWGHVNDPGGQEPGAQELSEKRGKIIYNYLIEKGINKERMSTIGYGAKFMLFPNPKNEKEQIKNRRVEIKIIEY